MKPSRPTRLRKLTFKAMENFEEKVAEFETELDKHWVIVSEVLQTDTSKCTTISRLDEVESDLFQSCGSYQTIERTYYEFLERVNTEESKHLFEKLIVTREDRKQSADSFAEKLSAIRQELGETASRVSRVSTTSTRVEEMKVRKQAELEAMKAQAIFVEREAALRQEKANIEHEEMLRRAASERRKAELESEMLVLNQQKQEAAIKAEAETLERLSEGKGSAILKLPTMHASDRVQSYILHSGGTETGTYGIVPQPPVETKHFNDFSKLNHTYVKECNHEQVRDLSKYLLKKELITSRLMKFDDRPENYLAWKGSFTSVMKELEPTREEEIDLLVKWLGPTSTHQAVSIRMANTGYPSRGLIRLWQRLDERYGAPELVEQALKKKLNEFPKINASNPRMLYNLTDIVSEIESVKENAEYEQMFSYYDTSYGVSPIVNKLPSYMQNKWVSEASNYKAMNHVLFPPFSFFAEFMRKQTKIRNDPSFHCYNEQTTRTVPLRNTMPNRNTGTMFTVSSRKTNTTEQLCPIHKTKHDLEQCRSFKAKTFNERRQILKDSNLCFRCCSTSHKARQCDVPIKCVSCGSDRHCSAMHLNMPARQNGEEPVTSKCTQVCGNSFTGKSCSKTILVNVYPKDQPEKATPMYAIVDDQSNRTLARSDFFDLFNVHTDETSYTLSSCSGTHSQAGRTANEFIVESVCGSNILNLPLILECNDIPNLRDEIPTPEVAQYHTHLSDLVDCIPPIDDQAQILLLIGRDLPEAHHVHEQRLGRKGSPYGQKLTLGWVIVGETCLGRTHITNSVNVNKTHLLENGRASLLKPCDSAFTVNQSQIDMYGDSCDPLFHRSSDDNKPALSREDRDFIQLMDSKFKKGVSGHWSAPLPFRQGRPRLPNNFDYAMKRAKALDMNMKKDDKKRQHIVEFMGKLMENGHAEVASELKDGQECWYLPVFGVYHPQKPDQIRCVFDSSAKYQGLALNSVLMQGPDLINSLLGILMRFRKEKVAIAADIQQMFYCFHVDECDRDFLRFLWYKDNDTDKQLIQYRMCVHVFGNSPSPAIANYGLVKSVEDAESDVQNFVSNDFYVDDGLISLPSALTAVDLLKRTQDCLKNSNLVLHKIVSNSEEVLAEFEGDQLAKCLKDLDLCRDRLPVQRSLGIHWDMDRDTFFFTAPQKDKPFTRRGVLSVINSLYDPMGFMAPVTVRGKLLLRELMVDSVDWDEPLPRDKIVNWTEWKKSLSLLEQVHIPRMYASFSMADASQIDLHVFSDASEKAIAASAYLCMQQTCETNSVGFVLGKAKVAPLSGHTIPRLELCAAVLATEVAETIQNQLHVRFRSIKFYTDSKIVLGYIHNQTRRFFTYVANRVEKIRKVSSPDQWKYVPSNKNPADVGSRGTSVEQMTESSWLLGPTFLRAKQDCDDSQSNTGEFTLVEPENDVEIRSVNVIKTHLYSQLSNDRFTRFSCWKRLVIAISCLLHVAESFHNDKQTQCHGWHLCDKTKTVKNYEQAERVVIRTVQQEAFHEEIQCIKNKMSLPKNSSIRNLNPFMDQNGVMRVGGRLEKSELPSTQKNPVIIPGKSHIATLLVRHYHKKICHQGRHFTSGAVRSAGYWVIGGKRLISSIIYHCVICRRQRGRFLEQKMAVLPQDRLEETPPFTNVGLDTFGPWYVVSRQTRGHKASGKRWAILFTCLVVRAIHIEVIEDLSSSSFINALRRFMAIRGKVKLFRSDRGTNFVGATDSISVDTINVEAGDVKNFLFNSGIVWKFNPPHSSHMGGSWERMIGVTRRILDNTLRNVSNLTHDVLTTLMSEVCAIVNNRPLIPVSWDAEEPEILTPNSILTHKVDSDRVPMGEIDTKDLYRQQWKRVKHLADIFWARWKKDYVQALQTRRKWNDDRTNVCVNDIVLVKCKDSARNEWPMGRVTEVYHSDDGKVRKVKVQINQSGLSRTYVRPIVDLVLLVSDD